MPLRIWPNDVDVYGHVNNGRYLTVLAGGRLDFSLRTGMMKVMIRRRWQPVVAAATVRFRRELKPLQRCTLVTRLSWWDAKWFYFEQRFERGDELYTVGLVKG